MNVFKAKKAQALVEFVLVFPFFLLIILGGIIDFGISANNYLTLQNLVSNAAEWAASNNQSKEEIIKYLQNNKPKNWNNPINVIEANKIKLNSGGFAIRIKAYYLSPVYTPFYQIASKTVFKSKSIKLAAIAAFKIPESKKHEK